MNKSKQPSKVNDHPLKRVRAIVVVAFLPFATHAAVPGAPDAGAILQQIQPVLPPAPLPSGTRLNIERDSASPLPASAAFEVKSVSISGNTAFDSATLHALVADAEGKTLTLPQLGEFAARITEYYRSRGFPLARAIIPAQTIQAGSVRIEVIEARYGRIGLDNSSRVRNSLLEATLSPLETGQVINQPVLDRVLLLLSDIPGVVVGATLKPGEAVGTADFLINTTPTPPVSGYVLADNYGNRFTGRARIGATVELNNPLNHGDVVSLSALSSGADLNYGRLAYDSLLNGHGTHVGGSYSVLDYALGESLTSLVVHGTAHVASFWARHPLVRSRSSNLYGQIQYDRLNLRDRIDVSAIRTDRHLDNITATLTGDAQDMLLSSAASTGSVSWTSGRVRFDNVAAQAADAGTARIAGAFSRWNANLSRVQSLGARNTLYLAGLYQGADGNLDSSQKMSAGGPHSVRAYDVGAISGDTGYLATAELRHEIGTVWGGQWQAIAFVDTAKVKINKSTWVAGTNTGTLSGFGVGLNWLGPHGWHARTYVATRLGASPPAVASGEHTRAWIEIGKGF